VKGSRGIMVGWILIYSVCHVGWNSMQGNKKKIN